MSYWRHARVETWGAFEMHGKCGAEGLVYCAAPSSVLVRHKLAPVEYKPGWCHAEVVAAGRPDTTQSGLHPTIRLISTLSQSGGVFCHAPLI